MTDCWLSADPDVERTESLALCALCTTRTALAQLALHHEQEALTSLLVTEPYSTIALNQVLAGLRRLEELDMPAPVVKYDVCLWFTAPLARQLQVVGVTTPGELVTLASNLGRAWWRRVSRTDPVAAMTIVRTLATAGTTLGRLGAHATGILLLAALLSPELVLYVRRVVLLEAIRLPTALDGRVGIDWGDINRCHTDALDDYQAIQTWLSPWSVGGHTWCAYRKEAECCLAQAILERSKASNDLLTGDCLTYRVSLAQKDFGPRWSGPQVVRTLPG